MQKRIVITGSSGFVGSKLSSALVTSHEILNIDRVDVTTNWEKDVLNLDIRKKIIDVPKYIGAAVIHTAAVLNTNDINKYWEVNVIGTKNILDWAVKHKSEHFIFISSGSVYGYARNLFMKENAPLNPIGAYGYTKLMGENLSQMYHKIHNLPVTILRLYFPYGPDQKNGIFYLIVRSIASGKPLTIKKYGSPKFQPIYIDDLKNAVIQVLRKNDGFNIYNICGDTVISFLELVHLIEKEYNMEAKLVHSEVDEGDLLANNTKIKNELNWHPLTNIVDGIRAII